MESGEELHNKVCQSPRLPRKAVLKLNLHHGRQDLHNLEARASVDHQSKEKGRERENPWRRVLGEPEAATSTSEYLVYHT